MPTSRLTTGTFCAARLALGLLGAGVCSADPYTPGTPGYCGAHTDALDCYLDTSPPSPAEQYFVKTTGPHFPNVTSAQMVQYARQSCKMLRQGTVTGYVVKDLADHMGTTMEWADQVMDGGMAADCPNLTVGADGVAR
jgi:hypothetical protein